MKFLKTHYFLIHLTLYTLLVLLLLIGQKNKESIVTIVIGFSLCSALFIETLFPFGKNVEIKTIKKDLLTTAINILFLWIGGLIVTYCFIWLNQVIWNSNTVFQNQQLGPVWVQTILVILFVDLMRYFIHRIQHSVPIFWAMHSQHHNVKTIYSLNNFYSHPIDLFIRHAIPAHLICAIGIHETALAIGLSFLGTIGIFSHCRVDINFGILNKYLTTPEVHRWHHSSHKDHENINFAPSLAFWDRIFGTYYFKNNCKGPESMGLSKNNEIITSTISPFNKFTLID